jgi:hypothetical protein
MFKATIQRIVTHYRCFLVINITKNMSNSIHTSHPTHIQLPFYNYFLLILLFIYMTYKLLVFSSPPPVCSVTEGGAIPGTPPGTTPLPPL